MLNIFKSFYTHSTPELQEDYQEPETAGPHVVWIHGANQSSNSFNFLRSQLPNWDCTLVEYSSHNTFYSNLTNILEHVKDRGPLFVVGHSLGGIYGLHLLKHCDVVGGVSISTPFRGSSAADWAKYIIPSYQLFKDVGRKSRPIIEANTISVTVPWVQIVSTTGGVPYLNGDNDGVVTVASMEHRKNEMNCIKVPHTHYEVMCSTTVSEIILKQYNNSSK